MFKSLYKVTGGWTQEEDYNHDCYYLGQWFTFEFGVQELEQLLQSVQRLGVRLLVNQNTDQVTNQVRLEQREEQLMNSLFEQKTKVCFRKKFQHINYMLAKLMLSTIRTLRLDVSQMTASWYTLQYTIKHNAIMGQRQSTYKYNLQSPVTHCN